MANLKEKLANVQASGVKIVTGSGSNSLSLSIVNSANNGKRLTTSKELTTKLNLTDVIHIVPNADDNEIYLSSVPILDISSSGKLSGTNKKICYSASLVALIVESLRLDYSSITSMSFANISFEELNGVQVAIVHVDPDKQLNSEVTEK